jgi:predicted nucleic acid-binding protein
VIAKEFEKKQSEIIREAIDRLIDQTGQSRKNKALREAAGIWKIGIADAILAATAEKENAELKTLNVKHYPMIKGLKPAYKK